MLPVLPRLLRSVSLVACFAAALHGGAVLAAPVEFSLEGTVARATGAAPYRLYAGDTVLISGTFNDAEIGEYGTAYIRFGQGTGNSMTLHLGDVTLTEQNATGYAAGFVPVLRFDNGALTSVAYESVAGELGATATLSSSWAAFDGPGVQGEWDLATYESSSKNLQVIAVPAAGGTTHYVVQDSRTGLMWMRDASAGGLRTWEDAKQWADDLVYAGYDDWRLPATRNPDPSCSYLDGSPRGANCTSEMGNLAFFEGITADNPGPFVNVRPFSPGYWSETMALDTASPFTTTIFMHSFGVNSLLQQIVSLATVTPLGEPTRYRYGDVWVVRGEAFADNRPSVGDLPPLDVTLPPEPAPEGLELVEVPMGNGVSHFVVKDHTTGLMWLQDASAGGLRTWEDGKRWAADLEYAGYDDWRLPRTPLEDPACSSLDGSALGMNCASEMGNLIFVEGINANAPEPFINVRPYSPGYWSETLYVETSSPFSTRAFMHSFGINSLLQQAASLAMVTPLGESTRYRYGDVWAVRAFDGVGALPEVPFEMAPEPEPATADLIWQASNGQMHYWTMRDGERVAGLDLDAPVSGAWSAKGAGDLNGDGADDIVWQHSSGQVHYWPMRNGERLGGNHIYTPVGSSWTLAGLGDVNGDGTDDIIWRHSSGQVHYWAMQNGERVAGYHIYTPVSSAWQLAAVGDVDGDGTDDIVWQHDSGQVHYWRMQDGARVTAHNIYSPVSTAWRLVAVGDVTGDGTDDIVWQHSSGQVHYWSMQNGERTGGANVSSPVGSGWRLVGVGDID